MKRFLVPSSRFLVLFGFVFGFGCTRTIDVPILTADGIGGLQLGMAQQAEGECAYVRPPGVPDAVMAMVVGGRVRRIDVTQQGPLTLAGVGVGAPEQTLLQAYPGATRSPHKYVADGRTVSVELEPLGGSPRRLVFETDGHAVTRFRIGLTPEVDWVEGCS